MSNLPPYKPIAVDALIPYACNARTHSDGQVAQIAASIREFGFLNPVLVDGANGIIAGHGRVLAARRLGLAEVPAIEIGHLTAAQRRAYILVDNKLALNAGWDDELLRLELGELRDEGFDLALTGFDPDELGELLADRTAGLTDPDAAPERPVNPVTRPGDTWLLGRHRLRCGDATAAGDVESVLAGAVPHLMVTDHWQHEPAWYAVRKGGRSHWQGARDQSTLWSIAPTGLADCATVHGTQKPVECMRRPLVNNSAPGQAVYDPFLGSGSTLIAAEIEGRSCLGLELDPAYCDVIVTRWQAFTGREATLEGDGRSFAVVSDERYDPAKDGRDSYHDAIAVLRERKEAIDA